MIRILKLPILIFLFLVIIASNTASAQSTSLFFSAPPTQVEEGQRFTIDVKVSSPSQSINAISGAVSFNDSLIHVISLSKDRSIINLWTEDPKVQRNKIVFEGIILNPGYQGSSGSIFKITFEARNVGTAQINWSEGAVLANDGLGSNVLATFGTTSVKIVPGPNFFENTNVVQSPTSPTPVGTPAKLVALPVITEYSASVASNGAAYLKGKGEPNALTKIVFEDISLKSIGEQFLEFLQTKKKKLDEVLVQNDETGAFQYTSSKNLVAGVYNATPFLVDSDSNTEKPGLGVQLLVTDSKIVKMLIVFINVLGLLIPIVGLIVIIYFIPWYSWKRMRVLRKKLTLEEEKVELSEHQLVRQDKLQDKLLDNTTDKLAHDNGHGLDTSVV
ncbi:MAG: cohesin domain-containing protein [Candidatus Paceibacterota bacterium]